MYKGNFCEKTALGKSEIHPRNQIFSHTSGPGVPLRHGKPNALYEHDSAFTALQVRKKWGDRSKVRNPHSKKEKTIR